MKLSFAPTKLGGGVTITSDVATLRYIERLLTRAAIESYSCDDNGMCMTLSRYFERNKETVDWVTLVAGVACLRTAIGYKLNRKDHAIICLLEYLLFAALCKVLNEPEEQIESVLESLHGLNDHTFDLSIEPKMTYLYLLKDPELRKEELLAIIKSLSPVFGRLDKKYDEKFKGLNREMLIYSSGTEFQYEL